MQTFEMIFMTIICKIMNLRICTTCKIINILIAYLPDKVPRIVEFYSLYFPN